MQFANTPCPTHVFDHWGSQLLLLESEVTLLMIWAWLSILLGTILQTIDICLFTFCIQPCMPPFNLLSQRENHLICFSSSARVEHYSKQSDIHRCWKCLVIQKGNKNLQPCWKPSPQHQPKTAWKYPLWSEETQLHKVKAISVLSLCNNAEMVEFMFLHKPPCLGNYINTKETCVEGWNLVFFMLYVKIKLKAGECT